MTNFARQVAVVVVHFGDGQLARDTIQSLMTLVPRPGHFAVVDNSRELELAYEQASSVDVLLPAQNLGFAGAVNLAVEYALDRRADHVWILNNDVTVRPDSLTWWELAVESRPDADVVGSYVTSGDDRCWFGGGAYDPRTGRASHMYTRQKVKDLPRGGVVPTGWVNGCSMFLPTASFVRRGPFDPWFFLYKEELEWQIRDPRAVAVVVQEPLVDHAVGATTGSTNGRLGRAFMARNGLILAFRQGSKVRTRWLWAWFVDYVLAALVRGRWAALSASWAGLRGVRQAPESFVESL